MARPALAPSWGGSAWVAFAALVPALTTASQLDLASVATDDAVVRTLGLGYTGPYRALDAWVTAPFAALPLGTRTLRAELGAVALLGASAAVLFVVVRRLLAAREAADTLTRVVSLIAAWTAACSAPFQHEGSVPGSDLLGALFVLVAIALPDRRWLAWKAGLFTLAASYQPSVGALVALALGARALARAERPAIRASELGIGFVAAALGLVPFILASLRSRRTPLSVGSAQVSPSRVVGGVHQAWVSLDGALGTFLLVLAAGGVALAVARPGSRRAAASLLALIVAASGLFAWRGGGDHGSWGAPGLVLIAGVASFAGACMLEAAARVASARLPLASTSAAMIVLLELAFPVVFLDDSATRASGVPRLPLAAWEDAAFTGVPSGSLLVIDDRALYARLLATEAVGDLPGDVELLPSFDPNNERTAAALARDASLVPLMRDIALAGGPEELSLSMLAGARALVMAPSADWDRAHSRHLVPTGLLSLFEPEPRGGTDRKRAALMTRPLRIRLAQALEGDEATWLRTMTASLLWDRALVAAKAGEHEVALLTLGDAEAFAPGDLRLLRLARDVERAKGPVDVRAYIERH